MAGIDPKVLILEEANALHLEDPGYKVKPFMLTHSSIFPKKNKRKKTTTTKTKIVPKKKKRKVARK